MTFGRWLFTAGNGWGIIEMGTGNSNNLWLIINRMISASM
jgi:hypothetical protein